jgi:hypothetical protein
LGRPGGRAQNKGNGPTATERWRNLGSASRPGNIEARALASTSLGATSNGGVRRPLIAPVAPTPDKT